MEGMRRDAFALAPEMEELFYALHRCPELGRSERRTAQRIRRRLEELGIPYVPLADTGTMAVIRGAGEGKTIGFRADIDALPIEEDTGLIYSSRNPGVMHACGHDCNAAMLLGTGLVLNRMRDKFQGAVKLLFQEAEEKAAGARIALESGLLEGADNSLSIHLLPDRDVGKFITRRGIFNAYCLYTDIVITGKGGHPAHPDYTVNPIFIGTNIMNAVNAMTAYEVGPYDTVVASALYFNAGRKGGSIPGECRLGFVFKYLEEKYGGFLREKISSIVEHCAKAAGGMGQVEYASTCPPMINDGASTERAVRVVEKLYGKDALLLTPPEFFGDDYAYIMQKYPGTMMNIGMAGNGNYTVGHNPGYMVDERCLGYGLNFMVHYCLDYFGAAE